MQSSLQALRVSFAHSELVPLVVDATFHLARGVTGLVGANGSGKTTLLRILAGELEPHSGEVRAGEVVLCPQRVDEPDARVLDLQAREDGEARALVAMLALDSRPWNELSPGMRKRWQIAGALAARPDVLLLDEPTNHLDAEGREILVSALRSFRGICVLVSHDRTLLSALATSILRIDRGRVRSYATGFDEAREAWEEEALAERRRWDDARDAERARTRALANLRVEHEQAIASRSSKNRMRDKNDSDGRGALAKGKAMFAEARLGQSVRIARGKLERVREVLPDKPVAALGRSLFLGFEPARTPVLATVDEAQISVGDRVVLRDVHRVVRRNDRIHVAGPNGAGKSTLLSRLRIERALVLPQELDVASARALLDRTRALPRESRGRVMQVVAALGVDPSNLLASESPSPGEARKLALALGLGAHAPALVLDEPTNHLDLPSIERLEEALAHYPGALVLVTHDARLAARCTTTTWRIEGGRVR